MEVKIKLEENCTQFELANIPRKAISLQNRMKSVSKQTIKEKGKIKVSIDTIQNQVKIQNIEREPLNFFDFPCKDQQSLDLNRSFIEDSDGLKFNTKLRGLNQSVSSSQTIKRQPIFQEQENPKDFSNFSQGYLQGLQDDSNNQETYEYEKQSTKRAKSKKIVKKGRNRKVRTTITLQKLNALNTHFNQFFQHKKRGQKPPLSLRQISQTLNLSYSTTLHKASVFRKNKQLKPGVLLSSLTQKRKYKKSYQCEKYIEQALKMRPFYSSLSLAKFIFRQFGVSYPRAIIGRHLTQMGYSSNNIKAHSLEKNGAICISLRKMYANILQPFLFSPIYIVYVDEAAFSKNLFRIKTTYSQFDFQKQKKQTQEDYVSVMIAMNCEKIIYYDIKDGFYEKSHFIEAIGQIHKSFFNCSYRSNSSFCLINDLNKIHYDHEPNDDSDICSISSTIAQYGLRRLFIPPGSTRLNPVELVISYVKKMLFTQREQITGCQELRLKLIRVMKSIASEPTKRFFYDFQKWFSKAKQGVPF